MMTLLVGCFLPEAHLTRLARLAGLAGVARITGG